jgi:hypothetical protein
MGGECGTWLEVQIVVQACSSFDHLFAVLGSMGYGYRQATDSTAEVVSACARII